MISCDSECGEMFTQMGLEGGGRGSRWLEGWNYRAGGGGGGRRVAEYRVRPSHLVSLS